MSDFNSVAPSGGFAAISKYNPHLWSAEQLRAIFVARQFELAELTRAIKELPDHIVPQHMLLVGSRGMGKSTLMQRLALKLSDEPDLADSWLALRFPEEQYTVNNLAQFWANVLDSLADSLERNGQPTLELDAEASRIATLPVEVQADAYLHTIVQTSQRLNRRLLLLVDNTDMLLNNLGKQGQWALRTILQQESRLMWVGGSYQSLEANSQYHDAFLDFFRVLELRPLSLAEMQQALLALARTFGGETAAELMQQQIQNQPERLPILRQLSGGNPRTTVMLYELLASKQSVDIRTDLEALLDSMTPLYKARLESLAELPRKLLAHILEYWAPIPLAKLAEMSQIVKSSISPQLQRLELEGLIEKTSLHGTTRSGYQVSERFFNIWYLMRLSSRRQRLKLKWLVEFLRLWFSSQELCDRAKHRLNYASQSNYDWEYEQALADALPEHLPEKHALRWKLLKELQQQREALHKIFEFDGVDRDFKGADDYLTRIKNVAALLRSCPFTTNEVLKQELITTVVGNIGLGLVEKESFANAMNWISEFQYRALLATATEANKNLARLMEEDVFEEIKVATLNFDFFPDAPDSNLAFRQIQSCFSNNPKTLFFASMLHLAKHRDESARQTLKLLTQALSSDSELLVYLGDLEQYHLEMYTEAEKSYRRALSLDKQNISAWCQLGILLGERFERYTDAELSFKNAIALDKTSVSSWNALGVLQHHHFLHYDDAEKSYRTAIELDSGNPYPIVNLARLLWEQDRKAEALKFYQNVVQLPDKKQPDELLLQAHLCLNNQQMALSALNTLAFKAQNKHVLAAFRLREQVWECSRLGLAERLADWMSDSPHWQYLQPMQQALYMLSGSETKLQDLPQEIQLLAEQIVADVKMRLPKQGK